MNKEKETDEKIGKMIEQLRQEINLEKIKDGAREIHSWIQDAVGDMANEYHSFVDDKWSGRIRTAKRAGVTDLKGWLADEYYNDVETLQDLCGDRIHDKCIEILGRHERPLSDMVFIMICMEMKEIAHPALVRALTILERPHAESIEP